MENTMKIPSDIILENISFITNEMKTRCLNKEYFKNYYMTTPGFLEFIVNDYLHCLDLYLQTNSDATFKDKVIWFKTISESQIPLRNSKLDLLDFSNELRNAVLCFIKENEDIIAQAFNEFSRIVESIFDGVK